MVLPDYIDCKIEYILHCDFYLTKDCKDTCGYALDIGGIGIGAADEGLGELLDNTEKEDEIIPQFDYQIPPTPDKTEDEGEE